MLGPQIANQLGWFAAEVGRQPWIVYGAAAHAGGAVGRGRGQHGADLARSCSRLIYLLLFAVFIYLLNDKIQHGPDEADLVPAGKLGVAAMT